jgi:hypothetical protein
MLVRIDLEKIRCRKKNQKIRLVKTKGFFKKCNRSNGSNRFYLLID